MTDVCGRTGKCTTYAIERPHPPPADRAAWLHMLASKRHSNPITSVMLTLDATTAVNGVDQPGRFSVKSYFARLIDAVVADASSAT